MHIRPFDEADWRAVWSIVEPVFRAGETYAYSPDISETQVRRVWVETPAATFVAEDEDKRLLGTYYIDLESSVGQGAECVIFFVWQGATTRNSALLQGVATQPGGK